MIFFISAFVMPENYEHRYENPQVQKLESEKQIQAPEATPEATPKSSEELKKEEIFEALQKLELPQNIKETLGEKITTLLLNNIPDDAVDFLNHFEKILKDPHSQKDFLKKGREVNNKITIPNETDNGWQEAWKKIQKDITSLKDNTRISTNQQLQIISRLADQWKHAEIENERLHYDEERIIPKRENFEKAFQEFGIHKKLIIEKQGKVGRLTFEVFLDDVLNKKFAIENSNNKKGKELLDDMYHQWTEAAIQNISNKKWTEFRDLLVSSQENDIQAKHKAQAQILQIEKDKNLTPEEKNEKKKAVHLSREQKAAESSKMLNRQEILISGLLKKEANYLQNKSNLIYTIQVIGHFYYNTSQVLIDGIWGPQTRDITSKILSEFENYPNFPLEAKNRLKALLDKRESYKNTSLQKKLEENQIESKYDTLAKSDLPSFKEKKAEEIKKSLEKIGRRNSETTNTTTGNPLLTGESSKIEFSNDQLESIIPQDLYLNKANEFFKRHPEIQGITAEMIMEGTADTKIMQIRQNSGEKQDLIDWQKQWQEMNLSQETNKAAIHAAEKFFANYGIVVNKSKTEQVIKESQSNPYYVFNDQYGKEFYYRPSSGKFSTQKFHVIDHEKKEIDLSGQSRQSYEVLLEIPPFEEFVSMAKKNKSDLLGNHRPKTAEDLQQQVKEKLSDQIHHSVGNIESRMIQYSIEGEQQKTQVMQGLEKAFNLKLKDNKLISKSEYPDYYQLLEPFTNSCAEASPHQLKQMSSLIDKIQSLKTISQTETRELSPGASSENRQDYVDKLQPKTFDNLLKLLLQPKNLQNFNQNSPLQQNNGISQLISWLSEGASGKASDYHKVDFKKLDFLLNPQSRNQPENQHYRISFQKLISDISQKYLNEEGNKEAVTTLQAMHFEKKVNTLA